MRYGTGVSAVKPGVFRITFLGKQAIIATDTAAIAVLQIGALGERNDLGEDFDFFLDAGPAAKESV